MIDIESRSIAKQIKRYAQVGGVVGKLATKLASQKYLGVKLDKEKQENIDLLQNNATVSIKVLNEKEDSGAIMGSMSGAIEYMREKELKESIETQNTAYAGTILELIESGGIIETKGNAQRL